MRIQKVHLWLENFRTIWLRTTRADGRSHNVPVWFWWNSETKAVYFVTHKNAVKTRNLSVDPKVAIHAGDGDDAVIMEGHASPVTDAGERSKISQCWLLKYGDDFARDALLYRVEISEMRVWEYQTNTRTEWQFDQVERV
jgi:general stress protein 26